MVWSFVWRFICGAAVFAYGVTFLIGFTMGVFGSSYETIRAVAMPVQVIGFLLAAYIAYWDVRTNG